MLSCQFGFFDAHLVTFLNLIKNLLVLLILIVKKYKKTCLVLLWHCSIGSELTCLVFLDNGAWSPM